MALNLSVHLWSHSSVIKFANLCLVITKHCPYSWNTMKQDPFPSRYVKVSSDSTNYVIWSLMDNPERHVTNHVTGLISKPIALSTFVQEGCVRIARVALDRKECDNALKRRVHASYGVLSFPKGYKLPVPRQFQPIYYSCCFDVRLAAGCCDTGSQSKTLVGTTDRLAVDATSRNLYSLQPKARMDGRKIHEERIYKRRE